MKKYNKEPKQSTVQLTLDEIVLEGARELLEKMLKEELTEYLGRLRYEHHIPGIEKQYRNGHGKERRLTVGSGSFPIRVPRLRVPYESHIVKRYQRYSDHIGQLFPQLYLHGLSTGDFQPAFSSLLGEHAPLSASTISRMKEQWQEEYKLWKKRTLDEEYLYVWADGVYPKAGPKDEQMAVLVVVGLNHKGEKEILAIEEGYRESFESWRDVLRNIHKRGTKWIGLVIGDGLPGFWRAIRDVYPRSKRQRCFVHKMRNILNNVPLKAQDEVHEALRAIYHARSLEEAQKLKDAFIFRYQRLYPKAILSLKEGAHLLFTYFYFPEKHWRSIKSTNVIESMFSAVKLRTNVARRIPKRESALYLVFKLLTDQQTRLRKINGCRLVAQCIESIKNSKKRIAA
jgi:putative transposase